ncbi:hypothetical protein RJ641_015519, partial [Dillenia turbinata]
YKNQFLTSLPPSHRQVLTSLALYLLLLHFYLCTKKEKVDKLKLIEVFGTSESEFCSVSTTMKDLCHDVFGVEKEKKERREVKGNLVDINNMLDSQSSCYKKRKRAEKHAYEEWKIMYQHPIIRTRQKWHLVGLDYGDMINNEGLHPLNQSLSGSTSEPLFSGLSPPLMCIPLEMIQLLVEILNSGGMLFICCNIHVSCCMQKLTELLKPPLKHIVVRSLRPLTCTLLKDSHGYMGVVLSNIEGTLLILCSFSNLADMKENYIICAILVKQGFPFAHRNMPIEQMKESTEQPHVIKTHVQNTMNQPQKGYKAPENGELPFVCKEFNIKLVDQEEMVSMVPIEENGSADQMLTWWSSSIGIYNSWICSLCVITYRVNCGYCGDCVGVASSGIRCTGSRGDVPTRREGWCQCF